MNDQEATEKSEPSSQRPQRDRTTTVVAWAATIIATLALAGGIYLEKEREKLKDRIHDVRLELRDTAAQLSRQDSDFASRDALARVEGDAARRMLELERRYDQIDASLEYLRNQSEGARGAWVRAEIEHVLRLAIQHLEIERDPQAALVALRAVERRLREYGEPSFAPVLERVAVDIAALERVPFPDIEGIALTLDAMGNRASSLPLAQPHGARPQLERRAREPGFAGVDWSRTWRRVRESFRSMVTIRREGRPTQVLIAPEEEFFIHLNTQLKLEAARVAALRHGNPTFRAAIRGTRAWVEDWYDGSDATVAAMLDELAQLEGQNLTPDLPDLSSTLRMVRAADERRGTR